MPSFEKPPTRDVTVASYHPNHFLMRFGRDMQVFLPMTTDFATISDELMAVYAHEYLHYLHNVSTVSGAKSVLWSNLVLGSVSGALVRMGPSETNVTYTPSERVQLAALLRYRDLYDGDQYRSDPRTAIRAVVAADTHAESLDFPRGPVSCPYVVLAIATDAGADPVRWVFGGLAIEEALAVLVQSSIEQVTGRLDAFYVPDFPYRVVDHLLRFILNEEPDPIAIFGLGTLALQSVYPGPEFLHLAREYRKQRRLRWTPQESVARVAKSGRRARGEVVELAMADVQDVARNHRGRGPMEGAYAAFAALFVQLQRRRHRDLFFDLDLAADGERSLQRVHELLGEVPPCNAIQERPGERDSFERDFLLAPHTPMGDAASVLQCQQHFALVEANASQGRSVSPTCPFYTSCGLEMRRDAPSICRETPWLRRGAGKTCAYGTAVDATTGLLRMTPPS